MIDADIAIKVMGWKQHGYMPDCWAIGPDELSFRQKHYFMPSTNIHHAWEVVEKMADRDPLIRRDGQGWMCIMDASDRADDTETKWHDHRTYTVARRRVEAKHDTAPMAIVLAALRAHNVPLPGGEGEEK